MAELAKAYLEQLDGKNRKKRVEFMFNPTEYSFSRTIEYEPVGNKGEDVPNREFGRGDGRTLNLELFVDTYEKGDDASKFVKKVEALLVVDRKTEDKGKKSRPPLVIFAWGSHTEFRSLITSMNVTYTLFHDDGRPARAKIKLTLKETADPNQTAGQNPSSLGSYGRASHRVQPGETLDLIAHEELGDARLWRYVAELNGIDDPWQLTPGQHLAVAIPER
jgi:hypothetical protein